MNDIHPIIGHVIAITHAGAKTAADVSSIPGLAASLAIAEKIYELCENVTRNRKAATQLATSCNELCKTVGNSFPGRPDSEVENITRELEKFLQETEEQMLTWNSLSKVQRFLQQDRIANDIMLCHGKIEDFCKRFMITANKEILHWQAQYEANREADHQELVEFLCDISNKQDLAIMTQVKANKSQAEDMRSLMNLMQQLFEDVKDAKDERKQFKDLLTNLAVVQKNSETYNIVVKSELFTKTSEKAVRGGKMYDIYEGTYLGQEKCAIKVIRGVATSPRTRERFDEEAQNWRTVFDKEKGKLILPLYGVCLDGQWPCLISPWMLNGNAIEYMRVNDGNMTRKYRLQFIRRIAEGINVLHDCGIAHGQIQGSNILVDHLGMPKLAGFGLSKAVADVGGGRVAEVSGMSDSWRWFAPETITGDGDIIIASDIYMFSMTVLELLTLERPFAEVPTRKIAIFLLHRKRPERPKEQKVKDRGLDDGLWALLEDCWQEESVNRPNIKEVLERLPK